MYKHVAVFAVVLFSAAAFGGDDAAKAAEAPHPTDVSTATKPATDTFESLDKNGDQRISRTEAGMDKNLSNIFAIADTDGDGYLSKAEYLARPRAN